MILSGRLSIALYEHVHLESLTI